MYFIPVLLIVLIIIVATPAERREGTLRSMLGAWALISVIGAIVFGVYLYRENEEIRAYEAAREQSRRAAEAQQAIAAATPPPKPGDWMWDRRTVLDRASRREGGF